jgi:hypothetical protein
MASAESSGAAPTEEPKPEVAPELHPEQNEHAPVETTVDMHVILGQADNNRMARINARRARIEASRIAKTKTEVVDGTPCCLLTL